jgi:hypothetical protein
MENSKTWSGWVAAGTHLFLSRGTFGHSQGSFGHVPGSFGHIQGSFGHIQGTFGHIQATLEHSHRRCLQLTLKRYNNDFLIGMCVRLFGFTGERSVGQATGHPVRTDPYPLLPLLFGNIHLLTFCFEALALKSSDSCTGACPTIRSGKKKFYCLSPHGYSRWCECETVPRKRQ